MKYKRVSFFEYYKEVDIEANSIEEALTASASFYNASQHKCVRELILAEDENCNWDVVKETWFEE